MNDSFVDHDKAVGMFVAAAAGDALGWPQENRSNIVGGAAARHVPPDPAFRAWTRNAGSQYGRYEDPVGPGEYSDDTQLFLAVARANLRMEDWLAWFTEVELPFWPTYQRGGGGAVLSAARAWADGHPPWVPAKTHTDAKVARYFEAGANGVAMRVAPHALLTAAHIDESALLERVISDGITTHGHPRALVGACVHALTVRNALRHPGNLAYGELIDSVAQSHAWRDPGLFMRVVPPGWLDSHARYTTGATHTDPARLWQRTCDEVMDLLEIAFEGLSRGATAKDEQTLGRIGVFDKDRLGAGTVAAVATLYVATRTAARPMSGLLRTGFLRDADTDTLCSMTGSVLGALHGTPWLAPLGDVQDRDYIIDSALRLAAVASGARSDDKELPSPKQPPTSNRIRKWVTETFDTGLASQAPDGRKVRVDDIRELRTKTRSFPLRARLITEEGQTLIVDKVLKSPLRDVHTKSAPAPEASGPKSSRSANETKTDPGTPAAAPRSTIVGVELRVTDLNASVAFFEQVLGFQAIRLSPDRTAIGSMLVLAQGPKTDAPQSGMRTVIAISCPDLGDIEQRARTHVSVKTEWSPSRDALWLLEPGGNVIRATTVGHRSQQSPAEGATSGPAGPTSEREVKLIEDALF